MTDEVIIYANQKIANGDGTFTTVRALYAKKDRQGNIIDETYVPKIGNSTITGDITIAGNLTINGESYETHAQQVYTKSDYLYMREGATGGLGNGKYAGLEFVKYDGTNNGRLVVDSSGTARVGDVGEEQPLLTRDEVSAMTDGQLLSWEGADSKAVTTGKLTHTLLMEMSGAPGDSDPQTDINGLELVRSDTGIGVAVGVGTGGTNHGLWSKKLGKWMVYANASKVYLNGNADTATSSTYATYLANSGGSTVTIKADTWTGGRLDSSDLRVWNQGWVSTSFGTDYGGISLWLHKESDSQSVINMQIDGEIYTRKGINLSSTTQNGAVNSGNDYAVSGGSVYTSLTDGTVTKVGTADVGGTTTPIYLKAGVPTAGTALGTMAYAATGDYLPLTGGTLTGNLTAQNGLSIKNMAWAPAGNIICGATANNNEWSFDITRNGYTGCYWHVWDSSYGSLLKVNADDGVVSAPKGGFSGNLTGNVTGNCSGSSGSCTGNSATATKATQDSDGNAINSTYLKLSGGTLTGNLNVQSASESQIHIRSKDLTWDTNGWRGSLFFHASDSTVNDCIVEYARESENLSKGRWVVRHLTAAGTVGYANEVKIYAGPNPYTTFSGSVISTTTDGYANFRAIGGNYGYMVRNDGSNVYGLMTASGQQYGTWTTARPWTINCSTGVMNINGNAATSTALTSSAGSTTQPVYFSSGKPVAGLIGSVHSWSITPANTTNYYPCVYVKDYTGNAHLKLQIEYATSTTTNQTIIQDYCWSTYYGQTQTLNSEHTSKFLRYMYIWSPKSESYYTNTNARPCVPIRFNTTTAGTLKVTVLESSNDLVFPDSLTAVTYSSTYWNSENNDINSYRGYLLNTYVNGDLSGTAGTSNNAWDTIIHDRYNLKQVMWYHSSTAYAQIGARLFGVGADGYYYLVARPDQTFALPFNGGRAYSNRTVANSYGNAQKSVRGINLSEFTTQYYANTANLTAGTTYSGTGTVYGYKYVVRTHTSTTAWSDATAVVIGKPIYICGNISSGAFKPYYTKASAQTCSIPSGQAGFTAATNVVCDVYTFYLTQTPWYTANYDSFLYIGKADMTTATLSIDTEKSVVYSYNGSNQLKGMDGRTIVNTDTGTSNKTGTKMYLVGGTSQASNVTTYSNSNCYIGTDNCLYSEGYRVMIHTRVWAGSYKCNTSATANALACFGVTTTGALAYHVYLIRYVDGRRYRTNSAERWATRLVQFSGDWYSTSASYRMMETTEVLSNLNHVGWDSDGGSGTPYPGFLIIASASSTYTLSDTTLVISQRTWKVTSAENTNSYDDNDNAYVKEVYRLY